MPRARRKSTLPPAFLAMLDDAGLSVTAASRLAGGPDVLRNVARGQSRAIRADTLDALASGIGRPMDEVWRALNDDTPTADASPAVNARSAPLRHRRAPVTMGPLLPARHIVDAGVWVEHEVQTLPRMKGPPISADPRYPRDAQWTELVRGDSFNRHYPAGAWVHVVDARTIDYAPRDDDLVVVERRRDGGELRERSLKQIVVSNGAVQLWPRSHNPAWNEPLKLPQDGQDADIEIVALVLGGYVPARLESDGS